MKRRTALKILALSALSEASSLVGSEGLPRLPSGQPGALARIRLYNPTQWRHQTFVEVPVGLLGSPGLIDWRNVHLVSKGSHVPFALREGTAHWKARLQPVTEPRAEDLIVFTAAVSPDAWSQFDLVSGARFQKSCMIRKDNQIVVSYPNLKVVIDQSTGMLLAVEAFSTRLLADSMGTEFFEVEEGVLDYAHGSPISYLHPKVRLKRKSSTTIPSKTRLVSSFSNEAATELNFILEPAQGPSMLLTYRVQCGGLIEICADERHWDGGCPWLNYGVEFSLNLTGEGRRLPNFETQFPLYGFQDYASVLRNVGMLYRVENVRVIETGEESINGRRWNRSFYFAGPDQLSRVDDMIELVDSGLIVSTVPVVRPMKPGIQVVYPDGAKAIAETLVGSLASSGFEAELSSESKSGHRNGIFLKQVEGHDEIGLEGDGFAIRPIRDSNDISITSRSRFGLMKGVLSLSENVRKINNVAAIPLISHNPGVDLRAGGFGGAPHEVDFPYGDDEEWIKVFDELIASGMNIMTCLGMWGNWKMPVTYRHMAELKSDSPDAYDEISGAKFSDFDSHSKRGLKLLNYLHDRGVRVWLWIPVGAIPTTFSEKFPEAVLSTNPKVPLVVHPKYQEYLRAFFKEILETYPVDGFVMIRDDNGVADTSDDFKKYLATSRTKHPVWEQYLIIYDILRSSGFKGDLAVYPYRDFYEPNLESVLPRDLFIVGHGSGLGTLTRSYTTLGPMGDTWLDNLYTGFRLPPTSRMKRLTSDRGAYWIGGAFHGTELPWYAVGAFAWQSSVTPNTLRHDWGLRAFGEKNALTFLRLNHSYEQLWKLMNGPLLPLTWLGMNSKQKRQVRKQCTQKLRIYRECLAALDSGARYSGNRDWFVQIELYGSFFEYCLNRLDLFGQLYEIVIAHQKSPAEFKPFSEETRRQIISIYGEMLNAAQPYANEIKRVPGGMMRATEPSAHPNREWFPGGFSPALDEALKIPVFGGVLAVAPEKLRGGEAFTLTLELLNTGICPWVPGEGHKLEFDPVGKRFGLPLTWELEGDWVLPGDRRVVTVTGMAPAEPGKATIAMRFWSPFGPESLPFIKHNLLLNWE